MPCRLIFLLASAALGVSTPLIPCYYRKATTCLSYSVDDFITRAVVVDIQRGDSNVTDGQRCSDNLLLQLYRASAARDVTAFAGALERASTCVIMY